MKCGSRHSLEVRARMSAARKKWWAARRSGGVEIPAWVPPDLVDEFIDVAAAEGEFAACRHVRRLKAAS